MKTFALTVGLWAAVMVTLFTQQGCSGSAVRAQTTAANLSARAFNASLPLWVSAYERECSAAVDRAEDYESATRALDDCNARWSHVALAWETAKALHDPWRRQLDACNREGGVCGPGVEEMGREFFASLNGWRCALRAVGHAEADRLPGTPSCATDGGAR